MIKVKFLIILLALVSLSSCKTVDGRQQVTAHNERFSDIASGIIGLVNQLIESVSQAFNSFVVQTTNWIQNELLEIENALASGVIAFNNYIEQVYAELKELIEEQIVPCLEHVPENIEKVREETRIAVEACREDGKMKLSAVRQDMENYRVINQLEVDGMSAYIHSCVDQPNLGDKIKCAVDAARNISASVSVIRENIANTSEIISAKIRSAVQETHECIAAAISDGRAKIHQIFQEAQQCLEAARETSSQATASEPAHGGENSEASSSLIVVNRKAKSDDDLTDQSFRLFM